MTARYILNADDYAISGGVSRAIVRLAEARRISSASAIVTRPRWLHDAKESRGLRDQIAIGLHLNLTLGKPIGPMPRLASSGVMPRLARLLMAANFGASAPGEIETEIERQLDAFEAAIGAPPDFIDGHQHVHALPVIRNGLLATLQRRDSARAILLRHPGDALRRILRRPAATAKAAMVAAMSRGFAAAACAAGFATNDGFSGFSKFAEDSAAVEADFASATSHLGPRHMIMCHPGYADDELASLDGVTQRRTLELAYLMRDTPFSAAVWRPQRRSDGRIIWPAHFSPEATP